MLTLILDDNLTALTNLQSRYAGTISLAYCDPPFGTGETQVGKAGSYADPKLPMEKFVAGICSRVSLLWTLLSDDGCLILHLDPRTSHHVKVALDALLGADHFASEIIWRYRRWPSKQANFQRVHDVLLRYVKCPGKQRWNQLYEPLSAATLRTTGGKKSLGTVENGKRKSTVTDELSPGCPLGDVWDLPIIAPTAKERLGWPTQKPEALLERLILACTNEGDTVIDPYCGSGTTLAVAERLGRSSIGIDQNPEAIIVAGKRLGMR